MRNTMLKSILSLVALSVSLSAHAVPSQYTHQGRLLDADEVPVEDTLEITFRMMDSESGGSALWEDTLTLTLENGFFNAVLGTDEEENPLDTEVLNQAPLWLEVQVAGEPTMVPRQPVLSVPYAAIAGEAEALDGGPVDATEISIGGIVVIDEDGQWVGTPPVIDWVDLTGVPADLADGDDDTQLSEAEVDAFVDDNGYALLADLSDYALTTALDAYARVGDLAAIAWSGDWADLTGVPADIADGDDNTQLDEAEVEDFVTNDALDLASGTTIGGAVIATGGGVPAGGIIMWSGVIVDIPEGWSLCDGTGGTPDLSGRFIQGVDGSTTDPGATGGSDSVTLTTDELPSHDHDLDDPGHIHDIPSGASGSGAVRGISSPDGTSATDSSTTGISIETAGSGLPFDNRPAYYALAFIIKG
jgi:hypothetical protein